MLTPSGAVFLCVCPFVHSFSFLPLYHISFLPESKQWSQKCCVLLVQNYKSIFQIQRQNFTCNEDTGFSMTKCLRKFIASKANCYINWFQTTTYPDCKTSEELKKIREAWSFLNKATFGEIVEKTGCGQKCLKIEYKLVLESNFDITWNSTKWLCEFYIYTYDKGVLKMCVQYLLLQLLYSLYNVFMVFFRNEYLTFDISDLIGSVGGYLGDDNIVYRHFIY